MAAINPLRYRSYYYDQETGLYFLMSRYYDPAICRFINADSFASTGQGILGHNMFAYCRNKPISRKDALGTDDVEVIDDKDGNPFNDLGRMPGEGIGGGSGSGGVRSLANNTNSGNTAHSQTGSNSSAVESFLKSNGADPQGVISSFKGTPTVQTLQTDTIVYRVWGGASHQFGHWVSPYDYGAAARSLLSLPGSNTMAYTSTFVIPRGTQVLTGVAAPLFGQPGGGIQWWVSEVR